MLPPDCLELYNDGRHYDLQVLGRDLKDVPYYLKQVKKYGGPVLELGCGTGRLTIPLAQQGHRITGLDVSQPMLDHAREKAEVDGVKIRWVHGDCRDFDLGEKFKTIIFPYNSFLHVQDREGVESTLVCVKKHLRDSGHFLLDVFNPDFKLLSRESSDQPVPFATYPDPDGKGTVTMSETSAYDRASQINRIKWHFRVSSGAEWVSDLNLRVFFPQELDALLHYNGFVIESKYGDLDESPFTSESPKQVIVASLAK